MNNENVIIIGGGMAGLSAGIYLARAGLKPLIFAGSPPGGQLTLTSDVENYPGYESILGAELVQKVRKQAEKFGARIVDENVKKVDFSKKSLKVYSTVDGRRWMVEDEDRRLKIEKNNISSTFYPLSSKSIIIATGAKALWLGVPGEKELRGKGVSACATCDGFFFRNKTVAVIGGGDTALEEALTLAKFASKVYLIHRRGEFRASKVMQKRVKSNPKIEIIYNASIEEVIGINRVEGIKINNLLGVGCDRPAQLKLDGVFVAIGHRPDTELFKDKILLDDKGYIITTNRIAQENFQFEIFNFQTNSNNPNFKNLNIENSLKIKNFKLEIQKFDINYPSQTSVRGVFATGDCVDYIYRQASTASGMGVQTALDVERYLENN